MTDLEKVKQDWFNLKFVENQTPEICLAAVKQDGYALEFVKNQTLEICLAAVRSRGLALRYVKDQTAEIVFVARQREKISVECAEKQFKFLFNEEFSDLSFNEIKDKVPEMFL